PGRGIFDRHVPAIEFDHLGAHLAMDSIQRGLADGRRGRLNSGQWFLSQSGSRAAGMVKPFTLTRSGLWALGARPGPPRAADRPIPIGTFAPSPSRATVPSCPPKSSTAACNVR